MRKKFLSVTFILFTITIWAQKKMTIGIEPGLPLIINKLSENLEKGYLINLAAEYQIRKHSNLTLNIGYQSFQAKMSTSLTPGRLVQYINGNLKFIKIGGGISFYPFSKFSVGTIIGLTIPETGISAINILSVGARDSSHIGEVNNYKGGGLRIYGDLQLGYHLLRDLKLRVNYSYMRQVYGITAINDKLSDLACLIFSLQYMVKI